MLTHTASRRVPVSRPKTRGRAPRGSGRSMQVRPGKIAFHGATSTLVIRSVLRAALILPRGDRATHR
jgi:hypothetical protein